MRSRAVRIHETGGPQVLRLEEVEVPEPGPGEARVRNEFAGVNFIDTYHRTGVYPSNLPLVLGQEGAGVVESVGQGVQAVAAGDRVAYAGGPPGSYSDLRLIQADRLIPLPGEIDTKTAAAITLRGMTVEYLIRRTFPVAKGMTVLWHAAAGGVGLLACEWLSSLGATVIGTVGSDRKATLARDHGCTHTINYKKEGFVGRVRELTEGEGVPVVYDGVGRSTLYGSLDCLAPRGLCVSFGNASGKPAPVDVLTLAEKGSVYLTRPRLGDYTGTREELLASASALFEAVAQNRIAVEIGQEYALEQAAEAHEALEERQTVGSTILSMG
ncbi:MAG TPA: quinone oxidoreductase [Thermoleophilia bacterium]|nr:quinone oxidoreductase [Thermoleophilia bacterium]